MSNNLNYNRKFRNFGVSKLVSTLTFDAYGDYARVKGQSVKRSVNSTALSIATRAKNSTTLDLKKQVPSKSDIRKYCRQNDEFKTLDDFINTGLKNKDYRGLSAAQSRRADLKHQLLTGLPYGPVI